jgi:hypothetical protein
MAFGAAGLLILRALLGAEVSADDGFARRFDALARAHRVFEVAPAAPASGMVDAAAPLTVLHTPPMLERADLEATVEAELPVLRACQSRAANTGRPFSGPAILDVVIRRSGRVAEVSVRPPRLAETRLGRCLLRRVARWRFPAFTGETEPGLTREAITASFPLRFGADTP